MIITPIHVYEHWRRKHRGEECGASWDWQYLGAVALHHLCGHIEHPDLDDPPVNGLESGRHDEL